MATYTLTNENGKSILEINIEDDGKTATAIYKQDDPNVYEETTFKVTRKTDNPLDLLKDISDQMKFADLPQWVPTGWQSA